MGYNGQCGCDCWLPIERVTNMAKLRHVSVYHCEDSIPTRHASTIILNMSLFSMQAGQQHLSSVLLNLRKSVAFPVSSCARTPGKFTGSYWYVLPMMAYQGVEADNLGGGV